MSVMHLNEVSSTLTWGSDVLSAACAETAMSRNVSAHSTIEVNTTGRKSSTRESKARRFLSPQVPAADRLPGLNGMASMISIIIAEAPGRERGRTALQKVQVLQPEIDLGVDRVIGRQRDLHVARGELHSRLEARGPAGREELLRVGAGAWAAGPRQPDLEPAVGSARRAGAAACGVGLR